MKDTPEDLTQISSDPTEVFVTEVAGKMRRGSLTASLDTERVNDNLEVLVVMPLHSPCLNCPSPWNRASR